MSNKPPTKTRRFFKLAKMTASVASNYTKTKLKSAFADEDETERAHQQAHAKNGELMAQTLGELKGVVMKVGQMASIAQDVLPPEMAQALTSLQNDSPPMPYELIAQQIERELGAPPERLYASFDETPFAAASIGQVHRAVTDDGRQVVVKVQYPGVDESCDSDLAQLRFALKMSGWVGSKSHREAFDGLFDQIRERMHEELDYCLEADQVRDFQRFHANDPHIIVPEVIGERSAQRVLTLSFEDGDGVEALGSASYTDEIRSLICERMIRMFIHQLFIHHNLHADPHPGNYAFRPDGSVVLYDYGCIEKINPVVAAKYQMMARAMYKEDFARVDKMLLSLGARVPNSPEVPLSYFAHWRRILLEPFVKDAQYNYATSTIHEQVREHAMEAMSYMDSFQPAPDLVFIDRAIVGLHNIFRRFGPTVSWRDLLEEALSIEQVALDESEI